MILRADGISQMAYVALRCLTTRWSGPGMQRLEQKKIERHADGLDNEGPIPGRSARSR
jgi:hypothetical protein